MEQNLKELRDYWYDNYSISIRDERFICALGFMSYIANAFDKEKVQFIQFVHDVGRVRVFISEKTPPIIEDEHVVFETEEESGGLPRALELIERAHRFTWEEVRYRIILTYNPATNGCSMSARTIDAARCRFLEAVLE